MTSLNKFKTDLKIRDKNERLGFSHGTCVLGVQVSYFTMPFAYIVISDQSTNAIEVTCMDKTVIVYHHVLFIN